MREFCGYTHVFIRPLVGLPQVLDENTRLHVDEVAVAACGISLIASTALPIRRSGHEQLKCTVA